MLTSSAAGVYVICPTPFESDGRVDEASTDRMVEAYLKAGATGLTILGIMGEAPKLAADEALAFARQVIDTVAGRVPVIVGVSAAGFAAMSGLSAKVMDAGAAGVMIAPPSTLKTDDQIVSYYADAVEAIGADVPWVLQDYPLTTNVVMTPKVIMRIIEQSPSCVMLKHEDWPGLDKITTLAPRERCRSSAPRLDPVRQRRHVPALRDGARRRRRHDGLCLSRDAGGRGQPHQPGQARRRRMTSSTGTCRWCATRRSPAWGWRCANTC